jgi:hypothetical protein
MAEELFKLPYKNVDIAHEIDCDPSNIAKWESGRHLPGLYHFAGLCEIGVDVIYVLTGERRNNET